MKSLHLLNILCLVINQNHKLNLKIKPQKRVQIVRKLRIIPPPELPDRTKSEQPKPVRGKLQITKLTLQKPMPKNHKSRKFKCVRCGLLCKTIAELNEHFISKHQKLKCLDCDKLFTKPWSYQKHMYLHKKAKHMWDIYGKGFSFRSQLAAHQPVHSILHNITVPAQSVTRVLPMLDI